MSLLKAKKVSKKDGEQKSTGIAILDNRQKTSKGGTSVYPLTFSVIAYGSLLIPAPVYRYIVKYFGTIEVLGKKPDKFCAPKRLNETIYTARMDTNGNPYNKATTGAHFGSDGMPFLANSERFEAFNASFTLLYYGVTDEDEFSTYLSTLAPAIGGYFLDILDEMIDECTLVYEKSGRRFIGGSLYTTKHHESLKKVKS